MTTLAGILIFIGGFTIYLWIDSLTDGSPSANAKADYYQRKGTEQWYKALDFDDIRPDMAAGNFSQAKHYWSEASKHRQAADPLPPWVLGVGLLIFFVGVLLKGL